MVREFNKMSISEALDIFGFKSGCNITKNMIKKKFRQLAMKYHQDKNPDKDPKILVKQFSKVVEAKEVLMRDFDAIATIPNKNGKPVKSVGSVFVDWLKTADTKDIKNPFTTYSKPQRKRK